MLKISTDGQTSKSPAPLLRLQGQVVGAWVIELRRVCDELLAGPLRPAAPLTLDLSEVSFIDADGVALVRELVAGGASITHASLFVAQQLKEVGHAHS